MRGSVTAFEAGRGVGTITADGTSYFFHCTRIADGTRTVNVGQAVEFVVVPGRRGDWEAADIEKVES